MTPRMNDVPLLHVLWDACESRKGEPDAFSLDASVHTAFGLVRLGEEKP